MRFVTRVLAINLGCDGRSFGKALVLVVRVVGTLVLEHREGEKSEVKGLAA